MLSHDLELLMKGAKEAQGNMKKAQLTLALVANNLEGMVKDARELENAQMPAAMQLNGVNAGDNVILLNKRSAKL